MIMLRILLIILLLLSYTAVNWWLSSARSSQNVSEWQISTGNVSKADNDRYNTSCYCAITLGGDIDFYFTIAYAPFGGILVVEIVL